jgi:hypothetical protein
MKKSQFSDNQTLTIIKQGENGILVPDLRREHGISNATSDKLNLRRISNHRRWGLTNMARPLMA